jgi:hypothetical protein
MYIEPIYTSVRTYEGGSNETRSRRCKLRPIPNGFHLNKSHAHIHTCDLVRHKTADYILVRHSMVREQNFDVLFRSVTFVVPEMEAKRRALTSVSSQ